MASGETRSFIACISIAQWWWQRRYRKKVLCENILKLFCKLGEDEENMVAVRSLSSLQAQYPLRKEKMLYGLRQLVRKGFLRHTGEEGWMLTRRGKRKGEEVQRLHLLWEVYLMRYLRVAADHVHDDAESIEHLLTPRLQAELESLVGDTSAKKS